MNAPRYHYNAKKCCAKPDSSFLAQDSPFPAFLYNIGPARSQTSALLIFISPSGFLALPQRNLAACCLSLVEECLAAAEEEEDLLGEEKMRG